MGPTHCSPMRPTALKLPASRQTTGALLAPMADADIDRGVIVSGEKIWFSVADADSEYLAIPLGDRAHAEWLSITLPLNGYCSVTAKIRGGRVGGRPPTVGRAEAAGRGVVGGGGWWGEAFRQRPVATSERI